MKDLGPLSQALLKNFLKEVFKTFKNFNQGDFYPYVQMVLFFVAVSVLRIPAAPRPIPSSGIGKAAIAARSATG